METLLPAWLAEISRQGFGYLLFLASLYVLARKDSELKACQEQARLDAVKMAVAFEQAAKAISESTEVERQRIEADKVTSEVLKGVIKQVDISDERAKDRALSINVTIESIVSKIEALLMRRGGRPGGA